MGIFCGVETVKRFVNIRLPYNVSSGVQRSGDAQGDLLDCMPPTNF